MKNKINFIFIAILASLIGCTDADEYKMYLEGGEIIYLQKADSLTAFPGKNRIQLKWILVDPRVTSYKVVYSQSAEKDSVIVPVSTDHDYSNDTISVIIDNLEETMYNFQIISSDEFGNKSIPVEIEESSYGEIYESSLVNRVIKQKLMSSGGLALEWYDGDESEVGVEINYSDEEGNEKVYFMPGEESSALISDYNPAYPFFYRALFMPDTTAIDIFYTEIESDQVIFPTELVNTVLPFEITSRGLWVQGRFGTPTGWTVNDAAAQNGNVDNAYGNALALWAWSGYSPVASFTNGKIYQTILLQPGNYKFRVTIKSFSPSLNKGYLAVCAGYDLSDIDQVESEALGYYRLISNPKPVEDDIIECMFTLESPAIVSLGMVANIDHAQEVDLKKVELVKE